MHIYTSDEWVELYRLAGEHMSCVKYAINEINMLSKFVM